MLTETQAPSMTPIYDALSAYQITAATRAAIELNLFTAIADGKRTAADIAKACNASERGVRILCDFLTVVGLLHKEGAQWSLTPDTQLFLNQKSPAYMGGTIGFMLHPFITGCFDNLTEVVRHGTTQRQDDGSLAPEHPVWVEFAKAMAPLSGVMAPQIAKQVDPEANKPLRILDIAASHGNYGLAFAKQNPQARITALDWANVLEVTRANATQAGVIDRYEFKPGSVHEVDLGGPYDVILLTNFLHHLDEKGIVELLKRLTTALAPDGVIATVEFVPNEDRISPAAPARFSMVMLASTPSGDAYTQSQYQRMFKDAGLGRVEFAGLPPSFQTLILSRRG